MKDKKHHEFMIKLDECYKVVQQSSNGISAVDIAKKLGVYRTTVYDRLNSIELMNKVESKHGLWYSKTGEQTIKPLEKEIEIVLPLPKNLMQHVALLDIVAKQAEDINFPKTANVYRTFLEKFNETRTIRIKGKNVDDLNLERIGNMVLESTKKSSKFDFKKILKKITG
jgi:hypothetical protein